MSKSNQFDFNDYFEHFFGRNFFSGFSINPFDDRFPPFRGEVYPSKQPDFKDGEVKEESGVNEDGSEWKSITYTSADGKSSYTSFTRVFNGSGNVIKNEPDECRLLKLKDQLNQAIKSENFEAAIKLSDEIQLLENKEKTDNE